MSVSVTLQSSRGGQDGLGSINDFVDRLYKQRGSMRDVTEESLREEIENEAAEGGVDTEGEDVVSETGEAEDLDARLKSLGSARDDMLALVG